MKNKKGFTIIELGVSIALVTTVALLLFQIVASVKKLYTGSDIQTTLLTKQGVMIKKIQDDLKDNTPTSITYCQNYLSNSCLLFTFSDGTTTELMVNPVQRKIKYKDYIIDYFEIDEDILFGELTFNSTTDFFTIKIPITTKNIDGNYDIHITSSANKVYNLGTISRMDMPVPKGSIPVRYDGENYWMAIYDSSMTFVQEFGKKYIQNLKIDTCSISNEALNEKVYEFKATPTSGETKAQWCQDTNFFSQKVENYQYISGINAGALDKDNYKTTVTEALSSTTIYIKINEYMQRYTFIAR